VDDRAILKLERLPQPLDSVKQRQDPSEVGVPSVVARDFEGAYPQRHFSAASRSRLRAASAISE
jgi:hypothetical protein